MKFIKIYSLVSTPVQETALLAALSDLKQVVSAVDGCEDFVIGRDRGAPFAYVVMEFWRSPEDQVASATAIPKVYFRAILDALAEPPATKDLLMLPSEIRPVELLVETATGDAGTRRHE